MSLAPRFIERGVIRAQCSNLFNLYFTLPDVPFSLIFCDLCNRDPDLPQTGFNIIAQGKRSATLGYRGGNPERLLRQRLVQRNNEPLKRYPENRDAPHPTTSQLFKTFDALSTYAIILDDRIIEVYCDDSSDTHRRVLKLLNISEDCF